MGDQSQANNKRIAKNAMYMYLRMGITMLVQLYTSRVVLDSLGDVNYGIYNVVGSFIVAFTFIQGPISSSIQRYLNYEMGSSSGNVNLIMTLSFYIYSALALSLLVVVELAGVWYINNKMVVPADRLYATHFAFQMSLFGLVLSIMKSPFEALIIAHEKFSYYAYISIVEVLLKLFNALSLSYIAIDKLELYSLNHLCIILVIFIIIYFYCRNNFKNDILFCKVKNYSKFREILSFSGWSLFSGVASMTATHGVNILINSFCGVVVNAAMGIANQVNSSISQFASNFQKAFNPQIVKLYASGERDKMCKLVSQSSRFSYLLLFMIVCPVSFNIDYLLKVWLKEPPEGASVFCLYLMIWQLLESLMAPMWTAVNATGIIKKYHLTMNPIILSVILFSYLSLQLGLPAYSVVVIKCLVDVVLLVVRIRFVNKLIGFDILLYIKETIFPIIIVSLISIITVLIFNSYVNNDNLRLIFGTVLFLLEYAFSVFCFGMQKQERERILFFLLHK
ncbi:MAG: hypothetical protein MJZ19_06660 [Paludibacteraceae bacterium]|nr:hypothetical protein [Paludibacteraceae bacterium]